MLPNSRQFVKFFLRFQNPNIIPIHFHYFQKYYKDPIYSPSFHHLQRLIILLLQKKVAGTSIPKIRIEMIMSKKRTLNDPNPPFKKKVKKDPNLVANGRFHCLAALEKFQCLVALERFQCLVANGRKRRSTFSHFHIFTFSHFPPTNFI